MESFKDFCNKMVEVRKCAAALRETLVENTLAAAMGVGVLL